MSDESKMAEILKAFEPLACLERTPSKALAHSFTELNAGGMAAFFNELAVLTKEWETSPECMWWCMTESLTPEAKYMLYTMHRKVNESKMKLVVVK